MMGSGKTLLAKVAALIATGAGPSLLTPKLGSEEELEKQITQALHGSAACILMDNVKVRLESSVLESALTLEEWSRRLLGRNDKDIRVPQRATWVVTGNNLEFGSEMSRRCYLIRLSPKVSRPEERTGFRHPRLIEFVSENRADLVWACLTLGRAWFAAGKPVPADLRTMGSFESWVEVIGGVLANAGVEGFLANRVRFREDADQEAAQWERFLRWLHKIQPAGGLTSKDTSQMVWGFEELLPDELARFVGKENFSHRIGLTFRKRCGTPVGSDGLRIEQAGKDGHTGVSRWRVVLGK